MKNFFTICLLLSASIQLAAQNINDPNAELRIAKDFHGISVSNAFDVVLTQGNEEAVAVSAADIKSRDKITVEVKAGILHIGFENGKMNWGSGNRKLKAYISFRQIDLLKISGACDVLVSGTIKSAVLAINQSGASDFKGRLQVEKLTVDLSGASDITVTGTATQLSVEASGASSFKGYELISDICNADASGASDIKITVNKEISANASGASDVHYKGSGVIRALKSSGSSSVSKG